MIDPSKLTKTDLEKILKDVERLDTLLDESYEKARALVMQVHEDGVDYVMKATEFAKSQGINCIVEPEGREEIVPCVEPQISVNTIRDCRLKKTGSDDYYPLSQEQGALLDKIKEEYGQKLKSYREKIAAIGTHCEIYYRKLLELTVVEKLVDAGQDDRIIAYLAHPDKRNLVRMTVDVKNFAVDPAVKNTFFNKYTRIDKLKGNVAHLEEGDMRVYYIRNFSSRVSAASVLIYVLREMRKEHFGYADSGREQQVLFDELKEENELRMRLELAMKHAEKGEPN